LLRSFSEFWNTARCKQTRQEFYTTHRIKIPYCSLCKKHLPYEFGCLGLGLLVLGAFIAFAMLFLGNASGLILSLPILPGMICTLLGVGLHFWQKQFVTPTCSRQQVAVEVSIVQSGDTQFDFVSGVYGKAFAKMNHTSSEEWERPQVYWTTKHWSYSLSVPVE
jgi:hypothetical protein